MLRWLKLIWFMLFGLLAVSASAGQSFDIKTAAIVKLSCKDYTIRVTGVADKGFHVDYQFTLTPASGPATTVTGKIPVDGVFDVSVPGVFTLATSGVFNGAGTATLKDNNGTTVNTVAISFGGVTPLNCPSPSTPKVLIKKFTNGHDGDNANGVPSSVFGEYVLSANTVAEVPAGGTLTWVYGVANTGAENLVKVQVTDDRLGPITCPKDALAVGEQMICTATGSAVALMLNPPAVVGGCGDNRPTYNNTGTVTAAGQNSGTPASDSDQSHYCNPPRAQACNLSLSKTCEIVQTSGPDWSTCKGKLQQFSMIWPSDAGTINISGIANNAPGGVVTPGQRVTFSGPFASNDNVLTISGAVSGQSTFHVSCSDKDMDGVSATNVEQPQLPGKAQDCGKFAGNGKSGSSGAINKWLVDGLVDAEGKVLNCSPTPTPPTASCSFEATDPPQCGTGGSFKPTTLTFQYTGGGCSTQSNSQASGKTSCSGSINPMQPVSVVFPGGSVASVPPGGTFTIPRSGSNTVITLTNSGGTENVGVHTSCSQPLIVGDVFFSLTLVAEDGIGLGKQVTYGYSVTNNGTSTAGPISVVDDKLGMIGSIAALPPGATQRLSKTTMIAQTTTNVATATAAGACSNPGVKATATVTVQAPPACSVSQELYKVEDDKVKYEITNNGNKVVTLDQLTMNFPLGRERIKEVKFDGTIYKSGNSNLFVGPGVTIDSGNWTESDIGKRQLKPGDTEKLEISFTSKTKSTASDFGGKVVFREGCEVDIGTGLAR